MKYLTLLSLVSLIFSGCSEQKPEPPLLQFIPAEHSNIDFSNQLFEDEQLNIITFEYFYNGAGVGVGDVNNDGLQDLFFSANMVNSRLYLNKGNFQFEDLTESAGINTQKRWCTGVAMVDINNDGWLDIYVSAAGPYGPERRKNLFYINQQDGTFKEQAAQMGLDDDGHTTQAAFFDYDLDGDLDVYLLTNITEEIGPNVIRPKQLNGESPNTDRLFRNDGGQFFDVSREAGILKEGYGLGVTVADINQDGWPDIYVSNDYLSNDLLYLNQQDGTFKDIAEEVFMHTSYSAMGNDIGDFNNDTYPDIVALDMLPPDNKRRKLMFSSINYNRYRSEILTGYYPQFMRNTLQLNNGMGPDLMRAFSEIGNLAGIAGTDWSWSALFADMDNDGWKDLLITNGYPRDITNMDFASYKADLLTKGRYNEATRRELINSINTIEGAYLPNYVYRNNGDLTFSDQSESWGFTRPSYSHGAAIADLDNDGDLDYVVNNSFDKAFVYENKIDPERSNYLRIKLIGSSGNKTGLGTKVYCYAGGKVQYQEFTLYRGFQSSVEPYLHFGTGTVKRIDSLKVIWPDQSEQVLIDVAANQLVTIDYQNATKRELSQSEEFYTLFNEVSNDLNINFKHAESHYNDFRIQPLLPHKFSQEGPCLTKGDINGDGLEDFFVGGAFKQSGQFFIQQNNGRFITKVLTDSTKYEEDTDALLFDADMDGDLDLYLVSGGSEFEPGSPYYQDRLYKNDGRGNFQWDRNSLPVMKTSGASVAAADFDGDGDQDLFVGGSCAPNTYPRPGKSYLLENQNGQFIEVTKDYAADLKSIGMVSDAIWLDYNQDNRPDLALCGQWMNIKLFQNENGRLRQVTDEVGLSQAVGWWNTLTAADLDNDGDTDLVAGNLGLNTPLKTAKAEPLQLYLNDFDGDGRLDPIMTHYLEHREVPWHFRDDILSWILPLRKRFPNYTSYAEASWAELFPAQAMENTQKFAVNTFASSWIENKGQKGFVVHALPMVAQMAPVNTIMIEDFNQDGFRDLLLAGNDYATETHTGRYDASMGQLLMGDGRGDFRAAPIRESGLYLKGDTRAVVMVDRGEQRPIVIAARNDDTLVIFEYLRVLQ